jgi:hypothetical protein
VDTVRGNNATQFIKMYWGNTAAVDSSKGTAVFDTSLGYKTVLHMSEATGDVNDATVNAVVGTNTGTTTTAGIAGAARRLAGTNAANTASEDGRQMIALGTPAALNFGGPLTMSAWVRWLNVAPTEGTSSYRTALWRGSSGGGEVFVRIGTTGEPNNYYAGRWTGSASLTTSTTVTASAAADSATWIHLSGVYNGSNWSLYRNGVLAGQSPDDPDGPQTPPTAWHIGRSGIGTNLNSRWWSGDIDEVRISRVARSADYMKLTYESQKAAQKLTDIGVVATVPRAPTDVMATAGAGFNTIAVSWMAPEDNGGATITQYKAYALSDTSKSCTTTGTLTCTITGLAAGSYVFSVRAINSVGASLPSPPSEPASPTVGIAPGVENVVFRVTDGNSPYAFRIPAGFLPTTERLSLSIFDTYGRTVWSGSVQPSRTIVAEVAWDGRTTAGAKASTGIYLARVQVERTGGTVESVHGGVKR